MAAARTLRIGLIPGDGIGREVIPAGRRILESLPSSLNLKFSFVDLDAGYETFQKTGTALPDKTVDTLKKECDGALFGAVSSPSTKVAGYSSPIVALRKKLDLYANVRPVKTTAGNSNGKPIDLVIVRENTEDLYVKEERTIEGPNGKVAEAIKRISENASFRISNIAGEIALRRQNIRAASPPLPVTSPWSPSPTSPTCSLRLTVSSVRPRAVLLPPRSSPPSSSRSRSSTPWSTSSSASPSSTMSLSPLTSTVTSSLTGCCCLVGSLGLVPSANVGDGFAIGEPCHGSAPDIEGKGISNPIATIRSVALMLEFLGEEKAAAQIYAAVDGNLDAAQFLTPDMGGKATTQQVLDDVLKRL
ncbi:hypothetical protein N7530_001937 [Penicillium desertorum]|uniref:Isopropylmalate dehydrogenase-like domain-containing protein n=1 Tax=Penicillium desertorum TaxID=1303715 RepID=A0A9X0BX27_9EURO|nr:hypothetical protein N7530_001937 [Penicillium desertorum]